MSIEPPDLSELKKLLEEKNMKTKNTNLNAAKRNPKDEFYTTRQVIEAELHNYEKYFEGKTVYCNCDDPEYSEFWQYFKRNFRPFRLKRLIATHYEPDDKNYAYVLDLSEDTNGDGVIDWKDDPVITQLPCNGDFRSAACIDLLKQADVVVTNPPFSLWRSYVAQLIEYKKDFIIIGNINAVTYKEVFPYIMNNQIWMGASIHSGDRKFYVPDDYPMKASSCGIDEEGRRFIRVKGVRWFTNIDIPQRHEKLDLRGNYYIPDLYPEYDNYDGIEVSKTGDIPCDYDGIMGVPVTFLDKYCPEQFDILGITDRNNLYGLTTKVYTKDDGKNYSDCNRRAAIRQSDGTLKSTYARLLIRNKNPEQRKYPNEN